MTCRRKRRYRDEIAAQRWRARGRNQPWTARN